MNVRVNLLPAEFVRRRRERIRRRFWLGTCVLLAVAQAPVILYVGEHAREVRRCRERATKLQAVLKQEKAERDTLRAQSDVLTRDIALAERLREKHCWSRWLGLLSLVVPDRVMLTGVQTEPSQFVETQAYLPKLSGEASGTPAATGVRTVRFRGAAAQHDDLMALLEAMNGLKWFRSVQLEQAKREKVADRDAIMFAVVCDW